MNKKELENEIIKTQEQLKKLQEALDEAEKLEKEVPETLDINDGDKYWCVDGSGNICLTWHAHTSPIDAGRVRKRRAFLSEEYAKAFSKKTQFIADMLHFKYLYDRDYKPNWDSDENKYYIYYNSETKKFEWSWSYAKVWQLFETVFFSTKQLAERCAEWLNKKYNLEDKNDG